MGENIDFGYYHTRAILTNDQKHVIITATYNIKDARCDKIFILDLNDNDEYSLRVSHVTLPQGNGGYRMVETGGGINDELLVFGYIGKIFQSITTMNMPSNDIIGIIAQFYSQETLHMLVFSGDEN